MLYSQSLQLLSYVWLFVTPWTAAHQPSLSVTNSWSLLRLMSIESVMPSNHLILCHAFLLSPSVFPSIRVFSNESALSIRWPKYWSFSFISPSNEHSGLWQHKSNSWQLSCVLWYGPFHVWCWRKLSLVADMFWLLVLLIGVVKEAYLRPAAAMLALILYLLKLCRILEENEYILWNKRHTHIHLFRSLCSSSPSEIILREKM